MMTDAYNTAAAAAIHGEIYERNPPPADASSSAVGKHRSDRVVLWWACCACPMMVGEAVQTVYPKKAARRVPRPLGTSRVFASGGSSGCRKYFLGGHELLPIAKHNTRIRIYCLKSIFFLTKLPMYVRKTSFFQL